MSLVAARTLLKARTASLAPQRRTFIDYLTNYPDKVRDVGGIRIGHQASRAAACMSGLFSFASYHTAHSSLTIFHYPLTDYGAKTCLPKVEEGLHLECVPRRQVRQRVGSLLDCRWWRTGRRGILALGDWKGKNGVITSMVRWNESADTLLVDSEP